MTRTLPQRARLVVVAICLVGLVCSCGSGSKAGATTGSPVVVPTPQSCPAGAGAGCLTLTAQSSAFDHSALALPANADVTVVFVDKDTGPLHNFAVYTGPDATTQLYAGAPTGPQPGSVLYQFHSPGPGTYFFRCDLHPDTMTGTLTVS